MCLERLQAQHHLVQVTEKKMKEYQVQLILHDMDQGKLPSKINSNRQWLGKSIEEQLLKQPTFESRSLTWMKICQLTMWSSGMRAEGSW